MIKRLTQFEGIGHFITLTKFNDSYKHPRTYHSMYNLAWHINTDQANMIEKQPQWEHKKKTLIHQTIFYLLILEIFQKSCYMDIGKLV